MKRHNSLIPLSRQHHETLIVAQLIKKGAPVYKGLPEDIEGKREYLLNFFKADLVNHFEAEERILIPIVSGKNKELDLFNERIISDHKKIVNYIEEIGRQRNIKDNMNELGNLLSGHIRFEERIYFELIQKILPELLLNKLENVLLLFLKTEN